MPVYAPRASRKRLRDGYTQETYRWVVWGRPRPVEAQPVPKTLTLADGTTLRTLPAPDHSDDMVCYLAEDHGLLFGGDLYVTRRPKYLRVDEHAPRLIESIQDILGHDFDTLLCGHQGAVRACSTGCRARLLKATPHCLLPERRGGRKRDCGVNAWYSALNVLR